MRLTKAAVAKRLDDAQRKQLNVVGTATANARKRSAVLVMGSGRREGTAKKMLENEIAARRAVAAPSAHAKDGGEVEGGLMGSLSLPGAGALR